MSDHVIDRKIQINSQNIDDQHLEHLPEPTKWIMIMDYDFKCLHSTTYRNEIALEKCS